METFAWRARDADGHPRQGTSTAADAGALVARLRHNGLLVLEVRTSLESEATLASGATHGSSPLRMPSLPPARIDVENALRQIALMLDSGMTLLEALREAATHSRRGSMRRVLAAIAAAVEGGSSFHQALARHPRAFAPLVCELVRAGEQSGTLDQALQRSADYLEQRREIRASVSQAMLYPSIVVAMTVIVAGLMVTAVIPRLEGFFSNSRNRLPEVTRALLTVSHWMRDYGAVVAITIFASLIVLWAIDCYTRGKRFIDRFAFYIPILGTIRRLGATTLFARSMSVLIGSGIPLVTALETTERILSRPTAAGAVARARRRVVEGDSLATSLERCPAFAPILVRMVAIGERSGSLEHVLHDVARYHEIELKGWIRRASFVIEPLITIIVGGIVGFVYIAFFLALFSAAGGV